MMALRKRSILGRVNLEALVAGRMPAQKRDSEA